MHTRERDNYQLLIVFDLSTMFKFHLLCGAPGREVRFTNALVFNLHERRLIYYSLGNMQAVTVQHVYYQAEFSLCVNMKYELFDVVCFLISFNLIFSFFFVFPTRTLRLSHL